MRRIKAVLIDAGRVLLHPNDAHFQHAARHLNIHLPANAGTRALGRTVWTGASTADPISFCNTPPKIQTWAHHAGLDEADGTAVWNHVHQLDATMPLWSRLEPTAERALIRLGRAGYRLAVVSNNDGRLRRQLTAAGIASHFAAIIDSAELGTAKPAAEIFLHTADELHVRPDQCVMIGDDPHFDIQASLRAGIPTSILIDAYHDRPHSWTTPACRTIGAASQLLLRGGPT
jgi:HAD superfamily hydrolase (TIGR01509 family)